MQIRISKKNTTATNISFNIQKKYKNIPDFEGKAGEIRQIYNKSKQEIYIGIGKEKEITKESLRKSAAIALKKIKSLKKKQFSINIPVLKDIQEKDVIYALAEGSLLTEYSFDKYKTDKKKIFNIESMEIITNKKYNKLIKDIQDICNAVNYTRDLVNESSEVVTPDMLAKEARKLAKESALLKVTVLDDNQIKKQGLGLIDAVGRGSIYPPRLIIMQYMGNKNNKEKIAIVGKGITFDSGGMNLKPSGSMETMREDMAGAGVVMGVMQAAIKLKIKVNLVGVIGAACNAIGPNAYLPGNIYKSYSGKTVNINNTDAEGRLVLADAISYTVKNYKPTKLVDLATLTGAILISFADVVSGLFSNNDDLSKELFDAGEEVNERLWRMPLYKEFQDAMNGELADLNNLSSLGRGKAGSITAAAFIEKFVEKTPWAHLDIAGTSFNEKVQGYIPKFATGFGVRLILKWLTRI